jgi:NACalpha-BTF3-like transcription factor
MKNDTKYITFDEFVMKTLREKNIEIKDLNILTENDFNQKYDITKNNLHKECIDLYKETHPDDYIKHIEQYREKINNQIKKTNEKKEELINMLMRQTTYTREEANNILENNNYDINLAIKYYLQPSNNKNLNLVNITTNQKIYKEIREFMNNNYEQYERRKELSKKFIKNN